MKKRLQFARKMKRDYRLDVWTKQIGFYLDGVSFVYKRNPLDQARAPKARIWRRKDEGLTTGCLAKGRKEGTGGNYVKVIVAISHNKGVIACHPFQKMTGRFLRLSSKNIFQGCLNWQARGVKISLFMITVHAKTPRWRKPLWRRPIQS